MSGWKEGQCIAIKWVRNQEEQFLDEVARVADEFAHGTKRAERVGVNGRCQSCDGEVEFPQRRPFTLAYEFGRTGCEGGLAVGSVLTMSQGYLSGIARDEHGPPTRTQRITQK